MLSIREIRKDVRNTSLNQCEYLVISLQHVSKGISKYPEMVNLNKRYVLGYVCQKRTRACKKRVLSTKLHKADWCVSIVIVENPSTQRK